MATPESLLAALAPTPYACTSLAVLAGGYGNYTYRGTLAVPLPSGAETVVVKHAEGFVPGNRQWVFPVTRSIHEAELLHALSSPTSGLPPIPSPSGLLRTSSVKLLHYDLPTHTQVLTDFRSSLDLKAYLTTHGSHVSPAQAHHLGHSLGLWLHALHAWANPSSPSDTQTAARATMRQNAAMGDLKHAVNFGRLGPAIATFPVELRGCEAVFADIEATMRAEMDGYKRGGGELIHGDFWCGNVLLADLPLPDAGAKTQGEPCVDDIVVIDWELSHFSTRAADVAQLLAELFLLYHFRGLQCAAHVMGGFLDGYGWEGGEGGRDREMAFRVAVALGTHLIVFAPQTRGWDPEWDARDVEGGDEKGRKMRECVSFGREVICHSWGQDRDAGWFSGGVLERIFSSSSEAERGGRWKRRRDGITIS